jgi:hypothetical protein
MMVLIKGFEKWISREEEQEIPEFESHEEARKYFKEKYGDNFQLSDSEMIDDRKCYFYYLIVDKEGYEEGMASMKKDGFVSGMRFMKSQQPIQIFEDGIIHIVH